ncbi:MAG: 30S ribosomal protein S20 [Holosporales bacterium]
MANIESAKKRARQAEVRNERNRARVSRIRTFIRKFEEALKGGDKASAEVAFKEAQPEIMRGVTKGVLHINTAARKISRMAAKVKSL